MDWFQFVTLVASAGIISSALSALGHWWIGRRQGRFLALRLAILFEDYASECTDAYFDHENAESSGGQIGSYTTYLPSPPIIPQDDPNWPALDHDSTQRAFSFAGGIRQFNDKVRFGGEVTGEVDHDEVISEAFIAAVRALILARDLRYRHEVGGLAASDARLKDLDEWRNEHRAKVQRQAERRQQRRAERAALREAPPNQ